MDIGTLTGSIEMENEVSGVLNTISSQVSRFADNFDGAMGVAAISVGVVTTAVGALSAAIVGLGNRGSDINDVRATLEQFAGSAENAEAIVSRMSAGVKGTITDFELAGNAARLLSANVQLSAEQFGTLSDAAFVLQNRGLGDTKQMLDLVSQAMITGRTRALEMKLGVIGTKDAEADFAKQLGVTKDELSQAGVTEARRIAILNLMQKAVAQAGEQEADFGEIMTSVVVKIKNWGDELASQVAKSPQVMNAIKSIGVALQDTFGTTGDTLMKNAVKGINDFADAVSRYAPIVISFFGRIRDSAISLWNWLTDMNERFQITDTIVRGARAAWDFLTSAVNLVRTAFTNLKQAWEDLPDWLQEAAKNATLAGIGFTAIGIGANAALSPVGSFVKQLDLGANIAANFIVTGGAAGKVMEKLADSTWATKLGAAYKFLEFGITNFGVSATLAAAKAELLERFLSSNLVTAIRFVGTALSTLFLNPVGLTILAVGGLVVGLRALTGSWEFLLVPLRAGWQLLKDVVVISINLAETIGTKLAPVLRDIKTFFSEIGSILNTIFTPAFKVAREAVFNLWEMMKQMPQFKGAAENIRQIHELAEEIRKVNKEREEAAKSDAEFWANVALAANPPAALSLLPRNLGTDVAPKFTPGMPEPPKLDFLKARTDLEDFQKKVRDLVRSLSDIRFTEDRAFSAAFEKLTSQALQSEEVILRLVPKIREYAELHHGFMPAAMKQVVDQADRINERFIAQGVATLSANKVSLERIAHLKEMGKSETEIAQMYDTTAGALQRYEQQLQRTRQLENQVNADRSVQIKKRLDAMIAADTMVINAAGDLSRQIRQSTQTDLQNQLDAIDEWADAEKKRYRDAGVDVETYTRLVTAESEFRKSRLLIDERAIRDNSRANLQEIADRARRTYEFMAQHPEIYSKGVIRQFKNIADAAQHHADATRTAWEKAFDGLRIASAIADIIPGKFGDVASKVVQHAENMAKAIQNALLTGDWIGVVVAGIAALGDALMGFFRHPGRQAVIDFAETFNTNAVGTGFDELHKKLLRLGPAGERMWQQLTSERNEKRAQEMIKRIQDALAQLDADMQRYNLTWVDLVDAQNEADLAAQDLIDTYDRLVDAGFDVSRVTERMADDLNEYIINAVDAGVKIPAAMRPIIESLIQQGKLSQEAANAILGLRDSSVPSLDDIRDAAERYGISLDSLGPKVKQLEITELADQYVADWKILTAATDDWGVIIDKMGPKVQSLILDAIKYGLELPAAMQPMIQAFIDAGALVDENGDKLTDLSKLNFAKPLSEMVDALIKKLDELIDTLVGPNGVAAGFDRLGRTRVNPITIPYRYEQQGPGPVHNTDGMEVDVPEPETFSTGGIVPTARILPFTPRGTDTVPAMLTPGEGIVNTAGMARLTAPNLEALNTGGALKVAGLDKVMNHVSDTSLGLARDSQAEKDMILRSLAGATSEQLRVAEEQAAQIQRSITKQNEIDIALDSVVSSIKEMRVREDGWIEEMMRRFRERAGPGENAPPLSPNLIEIPELVQIGGILSGPIKELINRVDPHMGEDKSVIAEQFRDVIERMNNRPRSIESNRQTTVSLGGIHIDGAQFGPDVTPEEVAQAAVDAVKRQMPEVIDAMLDTLDEGGKLQTRAANVTTKRGAA